MFEFVHDNFLVLCKEDFNIDDEYMIPAFIEGRSYFFRLVEVIPIELSGVYHSDEIIYMAINEFNCDHYLTVDEIEKYFDKLTTDITL